MALELTSQPYKHGRRWHVDYRSADGKMVNRLSFDAKPGRKAIDAALVRCAAQIDADALEAAKRDEDEAMFKARLVSDYGVADLDEFRAKVLTAARAKAGK